MNTKPLEKFAQAARRQLHEQVAAQLERVLRTDSAELRAQAEAIAELQEQIAAELARGRGRAGGLHLVQPLLRPALHGRQPLHRMGVVSPARRRASPSPRSCRRPSRATSTTTCPWTGQTRASTCWTGGCPRRDPQQEAYRLLLVAVCNAYHGVMPFLFEQIDDYTELLMPDDLLSAGSILQAVREALTPEACQDVEVIGWLYQFYISEKKDAGHRLARRRSQPEDIPAATQLFTPHWIVRYLVENSLGRLWMLNRPHSRLAEQMDYYIRAGSRKETRLSCASTSPEELRICDPAVRLAATC